MLFLLVLYFHEYTYIKKSKPNQRKERETIWAYSKMSCTVSGREPKVASLTVLGEKGE